jgi:hypothetical protein
VGVDNGDKTDPDLNLNREFKMIDQTYRETDISRVTSTGVVIMQIFYSKWSDVMMEIRKVKPTILCMGCHTQKGKDLELFRQVVEPHEILDSIRNWNESVSEQSPSRSQIRIIVSEWQMPAILKIIPVFFQKELILLLVTVVLLLMKTTSIFQEYSLTVSLDTIR